MSKLTKKEFIDAIAGNIDSDVSKATIEKVLAGVSTTITSSLKNGDQVVLPDVGMLEKRERPSRKGRNPQTGAEITIAASNVCGFKAVKAMKDNLNN